MAEEITPAEEVVPTTEPEQLSTEEPAVEPVAITEEPVAEEAPAPKRSKKSAPAEPVVEPVVEVAEVVAPRPKSNYPVAISRVTN